MDRSDQMKNEIDCSVTECPQGVTLPVNVVRPISPDLLSTKPSQSTSIISLIGSCSLSVSSVSISSDVHGNANPSNTENSVNLTHQTTASTVYDSQQNLVNETSLSMEFQARPVPIPLYLPTHPYCTFIENPIWDTLEDTFSKLPQIIFQTQSISTSSEYYPIWFEYSYLSIYNHIYIQISNVYEGYKKLLSKGPARAPFMTTELSVIAKARINTLNDWSKSIELWAREKEDIIKDTIFSQYNNDKELEINGGTIFIANTISEPIETHVLKIVNFQTDESFIANYSSKDQYSAMVPIINCVTLRNQSILVTPFQKFRDLHNYIQHNKKEAQKRAKVLMTHICQAVDYMHNHLGIAHMDLKLENILMNEKELPVLGDFGHSLITRHPIHNINTTTQNIQDFSYIYYTTQLMQYYKKNHVVDDIIGIDFPAFTATYTRFNDACQNSNDIMQYAVSFVVGAGGLLKHTVAIGGCSVRTGTIIPNNISYTPPNQAIFSPYNSNTSLNILSEILNHKGAVIDKITARELLEKDQLHFNMKKCDYDDLLRATSVSTHQQFHDAMVSLLKEKLSFDEDMINQYVSVEISPNSPLSVYNVLNSDLSKLARYSSKLSLGTYMYMAPEILAKDSYDPFKADIYSLGIIFFILMSAGQSPYRIPDVKKDQHYMWMMKNRNNPPLQGRIHPPMMTALVKAMPSIKFHRTVTDLLDMMMCVEFKKRATIREVITALNNVQF